MENLKNKSKLSSIDEKIETLKKEKAKIVQSLGKQIIDVLSKKEAFNHDFKTLLQGIHFVADELNKADSDYVNVWQKNAKPKSTKK